MFPPCPYLWALGLRVYLKEVLLSSQQFSSHLSEEKRGRKGYEQWKSATNLSSMSSSRYSNHASI